MATITLTELADGKIIQRSGVVGSISIAGTQTGATSIQARVVLHGTSTEVVSWTTIDSTPSASWSGVISDVPQGGWYNIQVRVGNEPATTANSTRKLGIGMLIGCTGQSNMDYWFRDGSSYTPNSTVRMYSTGAELPNALTWSWRTVTGDGAVTFCNILNDAIGIPIGILDTAPGACGIVAQVNDYPPAPTNGHWMDLTAGEPYPVFKTAVAAVGGYLEAILHVAGEAEAARGISAATFIATDSVTKGCGYFYESRLRVDVGNGSSFPNLPIFVAYLGAWNNTTDPNFWSVDSPAEWQTIRDAQKYLIGTIPDVHHMSVQIDLPYKADGLYIHHTTAGYATMATRSAQAVLHKLGYQSYSVGPIISSMRQSAANEVVINITPEAGTDFTPTTGITGFTILDSGVAETITSAVRNSADTIKLTIAGTITGTLSARYGYGVAVNDTYPVKDNSAITLPLNSNGNIGLSGTGFTRLAVNNLGKSLFKECSL